MHVNLNCNILESSNVIQTKMKNNSNKRKQEVKTLKAPPESDNRRLSAKYSSRTELDSVDGVEQILRFFKICNEKMARVDQRMANFETEHTKHMQKIVMLENKINQLGTISG